MVIPRLPRRKIIATTLALALLIGLIWVVLDIRWEMHVQTHLMPKVEKQLGFQTGTPYTMAGGNEIEVIMITEVTPGGVFGRAGLKQGDVLLDYRRSIAEFYTDLDSARGRTFTLRVVPNINGPALNKRKIKIATFAVPR